MDSEKNKQDDKLNRLMRWNRPVEVDPAKGDFLHQLYLMLRDAPPTVTAWAKQRAFECAADSKFAWRVIAITENALRRIAVNRNNDHIARGHPFSRKDRFETLFDKGNPVLSKDEVLRIFFEHDTTVLVTKEENNQHGVAHWSDLHEVPEDIFTSVGLAVYVRKRTDLPWVNKVLKDSPPLG
jgi:hypothetical protein